MNYPLLDEFNSGREMISTFGNFLTLTIDYCQKKIINDGGFMNPFFKTSATGLPEKDEDLDNLFFKSLSYQKISIIIKRFYAFKNRNENNLAICKFILSSNIANNDFVKKFIVYAQISVKDNMANIFASECFGAGDMNDGLLMIYELNNGRDKRIAYVTNLFSGYNLYLENWEFDVLQYISKGYTSKEIADLLNLSSYTVDDYRKSLLLKFEAKNTYQLIYYAQQKGIL